MQVPGSEMYRDINRVRQPKPIPGVTIFRYHCSLNFANMDSFQVWYGMVWFGLVWYGMVSDL